MNYEDAAAVLAKIQAYDGRTVSSANVAAWNEALEEVARADALAAVTEHFQESTDWLMPSHIMQRVKDRQFIGRQRIKAMGPPDFPTGLTQAEESDYRRRFHIAVARGWTREQSQADADHWVFGALAPLDAIDWHVQRTPAEWRSAFEAWLRDRELDQLESAPARAELDAAS